MIILVLQYILLNSEPTVSFPLFKKEKLKTERKNTTAEAVPIGWEAFHWPEN